MSYQTGKLLVYTIRGARNPIGVVVGTIHLNKSTMLSRNGVDIAVTIQSSGAFYTHQKQPRCLHLSESLPQERNHEPPSCASVPYYIRRSSPDTSQLIHHSGDVLAKDGFLLWDWLPRRMPVR